MAAIGSASWNCHNIYALSVSNPQPVVSDPHSVPLTCDPSWKHVCLFVNA
jgi:hypothetical protein